MSPARHQTVMNRQYQHWVLWLAVCLALLAALAPSVSHAVRALAGERAGAPASWVEICTSAPGAPATPDNSAGGSGRPSVFEHCPFCLLMADRLAPPSASTSLFFVAPGHAVRPGAPSVHTRPAQIIAAAQPRGPPAL